MSNLHIYLDKDINKDLIKTKKIAVIGFEIGRAHV